MKTKRVAANRRGFTLIEVIVVLATVGLLLALTLPAIQHARTQALRVVEANNLRQICLAVHQHAELHGRLPSAYSGDVRDGWVSAVLPHIEAANVRNCFDDQFTLEHWKNLRVAEIECPSAFTSPLLKDDHYVVTPIDTPSIQLHVRPTPFAFNVHLSQKDLASLATSNTLMFLTDSNVMPWSLSPEFSQLPNDDCEACGTSGPILAGMADGSVRRCTIHVLKEAVIKPY